MVTKEDEAAVREEVQASVSEWVAAGVSAVVVVGAVLIVLYSAVATGDDPPQIEFEVVRVVEQPDMWVVEFWIHNHGGTTAQSFVVEGVLVDEEGNVVETRQASLSFVPSNAKRMAGLFFRNDPSAHELRLMPVGYDHP